jgi:hypothetical protein
MFGWSDGSGAFFADIASPKMEANAPRRREPARLQVFTTQASREKGKRVNGGVLCLLHILYSNNIILVGGRMDGKQQKETFPGKVFYFCQLSQQPSALLQPNHNNPPTSNRQRSRPHTQFVPATHHAFRSSLSEDR